MRGKICGRSRIYSRSIIDQFQPVPLDKGLHLAEGLFGIQVPRLVKHVYYMPHISTIYYTGIGVSTKLFKTKYSTTDNIVKWEYYLDHFITEKEDKYYAKYQIARSLYLMNPSAKYFFSALWNYICGDYPVNKKILKSAWGLSLYLLRIANKTK
jgi:hypothetical protein